MRYAVAVALVALNTLALGCASPQSRASDTAWVRDSLLYEQRLAKWLVDSAVRDSLSHLVDTDSLFRLYRGMLVGDPHDMLQPQACERFRLAWRHGAIPVDLAVARMLDTVWRGVDRAALRRMESTPGRFTETSISPDICGITEPQGPSVVPGATVSEQYPRPRPPRKQ
jgi:hypothetical protein